jgi:hypothetical protein
MANPNPSPATRFGPANRANPGGRPKKTPLTDEIKRLLKQKAQGSEYTNQHMVAWKMIQMAQAGDVSAARLLWEYVEGKPTQRVEFDVAEEARKLAAEYGLDAAEILRTAELIAAGKA